MKLAIFKLLINDSSALSDIFLIPCQILVPYETQ